MYEELVKRLHQRIASTTAGSPLQDDLLEAADAIDELDTLLDGVRADNEALCETIEMLKKQVFDMSSLIGEYSEKTRWIPVTERLPDESGNYLTEFGDGTAMAVNEFMHPRDWLTEEGREAHPNGKWYWGGVTHWMPLPEPPKEEDKSGN